MVYVDDEEPFFHACDSSFPPTLGGAKTVHGASFSSDWGRITCITSEKITDSPIVFNKLEFLSRL